MLENWLSVDEESHLAFVFRFSTISQCTNEQREHAKSLIAWCLQRNPEHRPTVKQILTHPFITQRNSQTLMTVTAFIRQHMFISHFQKEASDFVQNVSYQLQQRGCSTWTDMRRKHITVDALQDGVKSSEIFVLVLTKGTLFRKFCLLEIFWAIQNGKLVIILQELDFRFAPFSFTEWEPVWRTDNQKGSTAFERVRDEILRDEGAQFADSLLRQVGALIRKPY
jgi:serine/threonine protein kinase